MKRKHNEGFSLTEVLVSMAILSAIAIPVCSSLVTCARLDAKSEEILRARIAVSSAVERLTAAGITGASETYDIVPGENGAVDNYPGVKVRTTAGSAPASASVPSYYNVEVTDDGGLVTVTTCIPAAEAEGGTTG